MGRIFKFLIAAILALVAIGFLLGLVSPDIPRELSSVYHVTWSTIYLRIIYIGIAIWAFLKWRGAKQNVNRLAFILVVGTVTLMIAVDIIEYLIPSSAGGFSHSAQTVVGYLLAAAVIFGLVADTRLRRRSPR